MAWLASDCAVLPLGELVEGAHRGTLPARAVALTLRRRLPRHADQCRADPGRGTGCRPPALSPPKASTPRTCSGGIGWRCCCSVTACARTSCCSNCRVSRAGCRRRHAANACSPTAWSITRSWLCSAPARDAVLAQVAAWAPDVAWTGTVPENDRWPVARPGGPGHRHRRSYRPSPAAAHAGSRHASARDGRQPRDPRTHHRPRGVTTGVSLRRLRRDDHRGSRRGRAARTRSRASRGRLWPATRRSGFRVSIRRSRTWIGSPHASCWRSLPTPVDREMVHLHVTSAGNEFMIHIAGLLAEGLGAEGVACQGRRRRRAARRSATSAPCRWWSRLTSSSRCISCARDPPSSWNPRLPPWPCSTSSSRAATGSRSRGSSRDGRDTCSTSARPASPSSSDAACSAVHVPLGYTPSLEAPDVRATAERPIDRAVSRPCIAAQARLLCTARRFLQRLQLSHRRQRRGAAAGGGHARATGPATSGCAWSPRAGSSCACTRRNVPYFEQHRAMLALANRCLLVTEIEPSHRAARRRRALRVGRARRAASGLPPLPRRPGGAREGRNCGPRTGRFPHAHPPELCGDARRAATAHGIGRPARCRRFCPGRGARAPGREPCPRGGRRHALDDDLSMPPTPRRRRLR